MIVNLSLTLIDVVVFISPPVVKLPLIFDIVTGPIVVGASSDKEVAVTVRTPDTPEIILVAVRSEVTISSVVIDDEVISDISAELPINVSALNSPVSISADIISVESIVDAVICKFDPKVFGLF